MRPYSYLFHLSKIRVSVILSSIRVSQMVSHFLTIISNQQYAGIRYFAVHAVSHSHLVRIPVLPQQR